MQARSIFKKTNNTFAILMCISIAFFLSCKSERRQQNEASQPEWVSLFNGENLDGWTIKIAGEPVNDNYKNTFRVDSNMIRVVYADYTAWDGKFGHIFYKTPYSYYKLKFDHRFNGVHLQDAPIWSDRNSGIMVHSQSPESMSLAQQFPISLEMQLLARVDSNANPTGNICTPGTLVHMGDSLRQDHCINSSSLTYEVGQWIHGEIEVFGDSLVRHIIEGDTVLVYQKPMIGGGFVGPSWAEGFITDSLTWIKKENTPLSMGYIALQAESQAIDFKNIEFLNLEGCMDPKASNYKSYYVKNNAESCKY